MQPIGWCFDIEADNLYIYAKQVWMVYLRDLNNPNKELAVYPFRDKQAGQKIKDWNSQYERPFIVGHNILGFDIFILLKFLGIEHTVGKDTFDGKPCIYVDTLYMSMFTNPDRDGHGLARWGERLGSAKIDFHDFSQYTQEMDVYCRQDVNLNVKLFWHLWEEFTSYYDVKGEMPQHYRSGQKSFYLMAVQAITGWKFDIEAAKALVVRIEGMMKEIEDEVLPQLPPRKMKKGEEKAHTIPAKPFKKDGTYSSHMLSFIEKHNGKIVDGRNVEFYGEVVEIVGGKVLDVKMPMSLGNQDDLKDWLLERGWEPTLFNYKRGPDGKPLREKGQLVPTTPKMQEAGRLCPNLEEMDGDLVKPIVKWLSLRNRLSVLTGWLENPRLAVDGRLPTESTGIASSFRIRHSVVVNCPKASDKVLLGKEFRSLFICEEGKLIAAGDAAALEGRVMGEYCVPMDAQALTRTGWKSFDQLTIGEDILAYNPETKMKDWTPLLEKCSFDNAEIFSIENRNFKVKATANHRWFVKYRNTITGDYSHKVVETKDLNTCCNIITNAPMTAYQGNTAGILDGKYGVDWITRTIGRGLQGVEAFVEGFLIADGYYSNRNAGKGDDTQLIGKGRWRFGQNLGEHFDAALTASYIAHSGYLNVSYRKTPTNQMGIVTLNKKSTITTQRMKVQSVGVGKVWCPRTKFGSWVMRQGDVITITGNTYKYDHGATAKELLEGDIHSKNAKAFYPEETLKFDINSPTFDKEDKEFKPYRDRSKNSFYAVLYGSGPPKLAKVLGKPESEGQAVYDAFWEANPATKALKDNVENFWETSGGKKWLPAIDGRRLITRKKSALLNTLFQSCGAIIMEYALNFMDAWLGGVKWKDGKPFYLYKGYVVQRVGYYHKFCGLGQ